MDIKKIAVLGSGTMGHGIAQAALFAGFEVSLYDIAQNLLDKAAAIIKGNIDKHFVAKGKLSQEEGDTIIGRLKTFSEFRQICGLSCRSLWPGMPGHGLRSGPFEEYRGSPIQGPVHLVGDRHGVAQ